MPAHASRQLEGVHSPATYSVEIQHPNTDGGIRTGGASVYYNRNVWAKYNFNLHSMSRPVCMWIKVGPHIEESITNSREGRPWRMSVL